MEEQKSDLVQATQEDMTLAPDKKSMKTYLPHNRYMVIDYPGVANVRVGNVSIPGNRLIKFGRGYAGGLNADDYADLEGQAPGGSLEACSAEELFNTYFLHRANLIITDWRADPAGISVMITTQLEREQVDDMTEVQELVTEEMRKRREKREENKIKEAEAAEAANVENARLIALGRKVEQQGLENRVKELEELNKKLSKDIKALKKGAK